MKTRLQFSFGPVQSFVAQARRTRDLYAGSLLLSHLALTSMRAISNGKIILPDFDVLSASEKKSDHATAPNRFIAEFDSEAAAATAARVAEDALWVEWRRIAGAVWDRYLEKAAALGERTIEIWQRQRDHFWNVSWVVGPATSTDLLDRRKNWQNKEAPVEGGDHCVLMGNLQELSGFIRSKQKQQQDAFWKVVCEKTSRLDLELNERLCAVAFIKRFLPSVAEQVIGRKFELQRWPSTVSIAALPWMRTIGARREFHAEAQAYAETAAGEPGATLASWRRIRLLEEFPLSAGRFRGLSGNFLNRTALANKGDTPIDELVRARLLKALQSLERHTLGRAGNFYAILLMDGDSMGALIGKHGPEAVTGALTDFAVMAPKVIEAHDGVCVYAGGDDLLALLPIDRALDAASKARQLYAESFGSEIPATVSAAIVYAHYHCTFSRVLAYAHELLDVVAKESTGRDSIAIGVLKPGGITCQWSAPFKHFISGPSHIFAPLIANFRDGRTLTSSLLYNLRERFSQLVEGDAARVQREDLLSLFTAEALIGERDSGNAAAQRVETGALMDQLLDVCEGRRRNRETGVEEATGVFTFDGPRLVKFLALDGKEGVK